MTFLSHREKGITNKEAADKFGVPKSTISTWIKNKEVFQALEESAPSTKKLRDCQYEKVNKALFGWFALQRSQNIPRDGSMIQEIVSPSPHTFFLVIMKYFPSVEKYYIVLNLLITAHFVRFSISQFVIFKPLTYCFKERIEFDVKASFASRP